MNIQLMKTYDDVKTLHKSVTSIGNAKTAVIKNDTSVINPHFILSYTGDCLTANYLYCSDLDRYYFINDYTLLTGNRIDLTCTVDVLKTAENSINQITATIVRQEKQGISILPDSNILVQNYNIVDIYSFSGGFDNTVGSYVLEILG